MRIVVHLLLFFLFLAVIFAVVDVQVLGIFVIIQKSVEVQRHHTCDEFFSCEPAEFFKHHRQVVVDVVAHDVDFFEVVDMSEQLFLAHLLCCRDEAAFHWLSELFFDSFNLMFLFLMHEADADACLVGTTCSSAAVHVSVDVVREVIVDDMCQVVDIQSAGCHVGSHQDLCEALAEVVHHEVALCL